MKRSQGFMGVRTTCKRRMREISLAFQDTASRVLRIVKQDAGRSVVGRDEVRAALAAHVWYGWRRLSHETRRVFLHALTAAALTEVAQRGAEEHRRSALTGVPVVLEMVARLRCYPARLVAVAIAAFQTLKRAYSLLARRAALAGDSACRGWRVAA
ncbi:hypothetical protein OG401_23940 [Kitasatospora purpeofusca]|uniref:hypothetical protein n=1 Tax=Kitasatospora purpeofusca TaxID=67352 RepID=UPI002258C23F|nr:hypothetical protein [Kitasatospora purpeofusca]MCX4687316.1 hypothetical protein [Kitasatospora purpeofusca]